MAKMADRHGQPTTRTRKPTETPVSRASRVRWRDGEVDSDHDRTPGQLRQGPSASGRPAHRYASPSKSQLRDQASARWQRASAESEEFPDNSDDTDEQVSDQDAETEDSDGEEASEFLEGGAVEKGTRGRRATPRRAHTVADPNAPPRPTRQAATAHAVSPAVPQSRTNAPSPSGQAEDKGEDKQLCKDMQELVWKVDALAKDVPEVRGSKSDFAKELFGNAENAETVRYITCLSSGGSKHRAGWEELLSDQACRQALVMGIVGRALKEHVFGALWFGATESLQKTLEDHEAGAGTVDQDAFSRTKSRAGAVNAQLGPSHGLQAAADKSSLQAAVDTLTLQLSALLKPLWDGKRGYLDAAFDSALRDIVQHAGIISRTIRRSRVVYHWPPTFKDEAFQPARMECCNLNHMISGSPYDQVKASGNDGGAVLRQGEEHRSEAMVRVVCFPGLVAYRRHGAPAGFRSKILCKSIVLLQWGKQGQAEALGP